MKQTIYCLIVFCLAGQVLHAQDLEQKKIIVFKVTVMDYYNIKHNGYLATMDDSALFISPQKFALTFEKINLKSFQAINYSEINMVNVQRRGSAGRAVLIGGVTGIITGAMIGASQPVNPGGFNDITRSLNGVIGAVIGGGIGCLLAAAISSLSKKVFIIDQQKDKFEKMREAMISRLY